jgi:RNA polymerase sigma factor (sigma-70 family)
VIDLTETFWETTYKQNIGRMTGICYRYTGDRETAGDLAHDAFLTAIDKSSGFEGKGPFEAWLWRIAVNVALQYLREQKKKKYLDDWMAYTTHVMETQEDNLTDKEDGFSEEELLEAINRLPEHHKLVFNLYVIDNFTHAQIGQELGMSEGTSKSHLARARKKIREILSDQLNEDRKKRKYALFLLVLPSKFWNIDRLYRKKFRKFRMKPRKVWKTDSVDFSKFSTPAPGSSAIYSMNYFMISVLSGTVAAVLFLVFNFSKETDMAGSGLIPVINTGGSPVVQFSGEQKEPVVQVSNKGRLSEKNKSTFSDSTDATISEKGIILSENINKIENMKRFKTLGAMLVAGSALAFDSTGQVKQNAAPSLVVENQETGNVISFNQPSKKKPVGDNASGTFYAERLSWSSSDNELYFKGKVVIDVEDNKFVGNGTFTFLGKVYYLVFEDAPVKTNSTLRLTEKKYKLKNLPPKKAMEKYGENGKNGAVEISLAD